MDLGSPPSIAKCSLLRGPHTLQTFLFYPVANGDFLPCSSSSLFLPLTPSREVRANMQRLNYQNNPLQFYPLEGINNSKRKCFPRLFYSAETEPKSSSNTLRTLPIGYLDTHFLTPLHDPLGPASTHNWRRDKLSGNRLYVPTFPPKRYRQKQSVSHFHMVP